MKRQGYVLSGVWETSIDGWLDWLRMRGLSPATIRLRRDHVRSIARRTHTAHPNELKPGMVLQIAVEHHWSNEHLKAMRTSLHSYFDWCVSNGIIDCNPALMPRVRTPIPAPRPAPDHVWEGLLAAAAPRERVMALLAGEAGLRRAEISVVHTDDFLEDAAGWSLVVHGKGGRQRIVPLTHSLAAEVRTFCGPARRGFIFEGQIDGHISAHYVGVLLSRLMPPGWSAHKLRHRYATRGYAGTGNLRAVQEALGHASVATTQRYTAVSSQDVRTVSEAAATRSADT